ncbi:uncharacterized protein LY89DRAFT_679731 [Mollisia scopiformis]|uniref:Uncharacterized protein n=1 Tax=Mollisia scopiformis TaxID=149040 RepID=A0A194XWI3_MOLSC|nr:uncharacterized protein LY89DRAFT_679731 [Mollisia scopiformis]KUJ24660.1 hypothetical protein LY89DRAFT_679731 [Mollisia scopiformis]
MGGGHSRPSRPAKTHAQQEQERFARAQREARRKKQQRENQERKREEQREKEEWLNTHTRLGYEERKWGLAGWWRLPFFIWWKERQAWNQELERRRRENGVPFGRMTAATGHRATGGNSEEMPLREHQD